MPLGPDALRVERLTKTWRAPFTPPHVALRALTLAIPRGAAFGLIGANGAGKTTFIKLLLGVARPDEGVVTVLGGSPDDTSVRARIGYLPERMHLPAALTGAHFLRSMSTLKRTPMTKAECEAMLARVGLSGVTQRIGSYSKGMRQRLGLASALIGAPELLVLDEPTDGIDPVGRVEVRAILLAEKQRGATILLNSHLLTETERVCDRIGILEKGVLRLEGTLDEVRRAAKRWRVRFAEGVDVAVLRGCGFVEARDEWWFEGDDPATLNAALEAARARGALLVELSPATRDLEQVLSETLEGTS